MASAGDQIGIAETLAYLDRLGGGAMRGIPVSGGELLLGRRYQQIAALDAVTRLFQNQSVDQALGARQPTRRMACVASKHQKESQPEGAASSAGPLARTQSEVRVVRSFDRTERVVVASYQIGRPGEQLQIPRPESLHPVGCRKKLEGITPRSPAVAF